MEQLKLFLLAHNSMVVEISFPKTKKRKNSLPEKTVMQQMMRGCMNHEKHVPLR